MAIQYPKSTHVTLPSVEQWAQNINILRDPPKSITTRRIDKVGQNTDITNLVDDSGDRICEGINVYTRGVNPMVSVSYDNSSGNAGLSGNPTAYSNRVAAKPPYPAFEGGAFRPPIRTQRDLLPLSRQPRAWFGTVTAPEFIDYAKTKQQPNDYRAIKELSLLAFDVIPNKTTTIDKGILANFHMTDHINDERITLLNTSAGKEWNYFSSYTKENADVQKGALDEVLHADALANRTMDRTATVEGYEFNPAKYITEDGLLVESYTNPSAHRTAGYGSDDVKVQTGKYVGDISQIEQNSNVSSHRLQNLEDLTIQSDRYIQDISQIQTGTNVSRATAQGVNDMTIQSDRYIQDISQIDTVTNVSRQTMQGLEDLSIQSDRYIQDIAQAQRTTNISQITAQGVDDMRIQPERYTHDIHQIQRNSNVSANVQAKKLDELFDNGRVSVKNEMIHYAASAGKNPNVTFLNEIAQPELEMRNPLVQVTAQRTQTEVAKRVDHEKDHRLYRHTPLTDARTNITKIDDFNNINTNMESRTVRLDPLLRKGGFNNVGNKPSMARPQVRAMPERESDRDRLRNRMNEMQFNRH